MSKWTVRKPEPSNIRGVCVDCNKNLQKKTSRGKYQALCSSCDNKRFGIKRKHKPKWLYGYRKHKLKVCERCGFIPKDRCQLDVHHKDGNHNNNDPNNLETLCANCHRLEHKRPPVTPLKELQGVSLFK